MVTLAQKRACERNFRALLDDHGLSQPDAVEYGFTCVRFLWYEEKLCVIVDIDEGGGERLSIDGQEPANAA